MKAVVVDRRSANGMLLTELPEPAAGDGQVLVEVHHASLNHGDLNDAVSGRLETGTVLGSDVAGVVVEAAASGAGPATGSRVVALASGGFAERVVVDIDDVADVPSDVGLDVVAALPVAGLAAVQALRAGALAAGKRVMVTGASGGVGRFAVAIAADAGAYVIASVGSPARAAGLAELGASEVLVGLDEISEPVDLVIDNVGGQTLVAAWERLSAGGRVESVGWASGEPAAFAPYSTIGGGRTLHAFLIERPVGRDLAELVARVAAGRLRPELGWRGSLEQLPEAVAALRERRVNGKAVFDFR